MYSLILFGEGNGSPLQYSCLENPMDGGAWQAIVRGVTKSRTQLKWLNMHALFLFCCYSLSLSRVRLFATPWTASCQASLSFIISLNLLKLMSSESVMPSHHLILCCHFLLLPSIFPSIRVFSNESVLCIWWPKYWSFSFNISPSNEYSGLISFRIDFLAVQGILQHHSSKAWILWLSAFFPTLTSIHDY